MNEKSLLENSKLKLVFDDSGCLASVIDLIHDQTVNCEVRKNSVWQLTFRREDGELHKVSSQDAELVKSEPAEDGTGKLAFKWKIKNLDSEVKTVVSLDGDQLSDWRMEVSNNSGMALWEAKYPIIGGLSTFEGDGQNDRLVVPWQFGCEIPNPIEILKGDGPRKRNWISEYGHCDTDEGVNKFAYAYPGMWSMQFMAFYHLEKLGIYFAAHDPEANFKRFGMYQESDEKVSLVMTNFPEERIAVNVDYTLPYPVKIGVFKGDWCDSAKIYREWAIKQKWCSKGKIREREDVPQWVKNTDFWYWNWSSHMKDSHNATPALFAPAVVELKKQLGCEISAHWYGSQCEPFNLRMPEIFNLCKTKKEKLRKGLELMHANGIHAIPYMNPRMCDDDTETWRENNCEELACITEDSTMHEEFYFEGMKWYTICPTQEQWHKVINEILEECVELKYDGAYVDQVSSCYVVPCFSNKHGHSRGGGNTWYKGNCEMMEYTINRLKNKKDICFASESTVECYNDIFDINLARGVTLLDFCVQGGDDYPIPLCNAIYHDYMMTYGSTTVFSKDNPDFVYYAGALTLVSGNQLSFEGCTWSDLKKGKYKDYIEYYRTLCQFRKKHREFFNFGEWEKPVSIETDSVILDISKLRPEWNAPAVLTGTWKLDGKKLIYFANHTDKDRKIKFTLNNEIQEIEIPSRSVTGIVES